MAYRRRRVTYRRRRNNADIATWNNYLLDAEEATLCGTKADHLHGGPLSFRKGA